eukprot:2365134-Alexandrium_andersonii.AAC.1
MLYRRAAPNAECFFYFYWLAEGAVPRCHAQVTAAGRKPQSSTGVNYTRGEGLSLIHISEPTRLALI